MHQTDSTQETRRLVEEARHAGRTICFIPTMGALHEGHCSLFRMAGTGAFRIVSIFVNPTQFNSVDDLKKYPRTLDQDLRLCEAEGVDLVFTPTVKEVYPDGPMIDIPVPAVGLPMEGKFRPGHFAGVCSVVKRLFDIVQPDAACFGEKDFQQIRVIEEMVKEQRIPVTIIRCPTVRDKNGLALSSRNARLSAEGYQKALAIPRAIQKVKEIVGAGERDVQRIIENVGVQYIEPLRIDYLVAVNETDLQPVTTIAPDSRLFIAAWVEEVRLIDNDRLF